MRFEFYHDPGHGWLKVSRNFLHELGIWDKVSHYSHVSWNGDNVFLEEDCDASLFFNAMLKKGIAYTVRNHYVNFSSRIRNYPAYQPY